MSIALDSLLLGDAPEAWRAAGFSVEGGAVVVGSVRILCTADGGGPNRWVLVSLDGAVVPDAVDGIATSSAPVEERDPTGGIEHPNGVVGFDHVVVHSPDLDRTTEALGRLGLECRRTRDVPGTGGSRPVQQRFFRAGGTILELVGPPWPSGDGPARIWGYALVAADLHRAADVLGDRLGEVKDAVQPGRRIATLRTRELGISVPVAIMSPHRR